MPHLTFSGLERKELMDLSKELVDGLSVIVGSERSHFTLALDESTFIFDGDEKKPDPFIQIAWFDRGQEVKDRVASFVTERIQSAGYDEVSIWFVNLDKSSYYDNGVHYGA